VHSIAYLGPAGTFAEAAARQLPEVAGGADLRPVASVPAALEAVREGMTDGALVPLENSVEGSVNTTLDELATGEHLLIRREVITPVTFDFLALEGRHLGDVRTVATHPHAAAQCRRWLRSVELDTAVRLTSSTADAAASVAKGEFDAAIAAPLAADQYGLVAVARDIGDARHAVTRFVLIGRPTGPEERTGADRTSLVAYIAEDHSGALMEVLNEFAVRGVNLTRIESRPTGERLGRYCFFLDCEGHIADARVGEALSGLFRVCSEVRYLGSYPRADHVAPQQRPGTTDADFSAAADWLRGLRSDGR